MRELVVYDTNIFVSYFLFPFKKGTIKTVVDQLFDRKTICVFCDTIMAEYDKVLHYKKFGFSHSEIRTLLDFILINGRYVVPLPTQVPFIDITDKCFYDAALTAGADWLITGNKKHYPTEPFIVTAAEYLQLTGGVL